MAATAILVRCSTRRVEDEVEKKIKEKLASYIIKGEVKHCWPCGGPKFRNFKRYNIKKSVTTAFIDGGGTDRASSLTKKFFSLICELGPGSGNRRQTQQCGVLLFKHIS